MEIDNGQSPGAGPSRSRSPSAVSSRSSSSGSTASSGSRKGKERAQDVADEESDGEAVNGEAGSEKRSTRGSIRSSRSRNGVLQEGSKAAAMSQRKHSAEGDARSDRDVEDDEDDDEGEDEGEEDEDEEDEDEDDEDEEPTLKYSRLKGKIPEILAKDKACAIEVGTRIIAIGTVNGMVHVLTYEGAKVKSYRPHAGSVTCLKIDEENDFIATSSFEGRVIIHSLTTPEQYVFDYKRPMQTISLEPGFAKKNTKAFVCGGLAGSLIHQEKGWVGWKEQILHSNEGPIWATEWRGDLIAWANDLGVKIYDTSTSQRIGFIDRGANAPRAELFKCSMFWKDDHTLVIGWADYIKIVRIRSRSRSQQSTGLPPLTVELTAIFQVDCMISGIAPFGSSYIVLAYIPPDTYDNEATEDRMEQRRKAANRPELRVITSKGEEVSADALSLGNYHLYGCNDYSLVKTLDQPTDRTNGRDLQQVSESYFVLSPADVIIVKPRDENDHIEWLVEREKFEEALEAAEKMQKEHGALDAQAIGLKYMHHLVDKGDYDRAAALAPRVLDQNAGAWQTWVDIFSEKDQLPAFVPLVPVKKPRLAAKSYDDILTHLLFRDKAIFLSTIKSWPGGIYTPKTIIEVVLSELRGNQNDEILVEAMAEIHIHNHQPAKALPYLLQLGRPEVFDLIRENNLFDAVRDQALSLVEFDQKRREALDTVIGDSSDPEKGDVQRDATEYGPAIQLLVDHVASIPVDRVVKQLELPKPEYLYFYLDALFHKDQQLAFPYSDRMVELYAQFASNHLMSLLRASNFYDLEKAYQICKENDLVPEMVFLLGRMGNNKEALMLIIERLGDVQKAIDFAKEQADDDLWEDLLQYSETRPDFIRALLEHVGAEINPVRLISRIKDGMEIPGLKPALVKILQASNLQVSLMEGCHEILNGDCAKLANELQVAQTGGTRCATDDTCAVCGLLAFPYKPSSSSPSSSLILVYLCRHLVHATCSLLNPDLELPQRAEHPAINQLLSNDRRGAKTQRREMGSKLSYAAGVRVRVGKCPVCEHSRGSTELGLPRQRGIRVEV